MSLELQQSPRFYPSFDHARHAIDLLPARYCYEIEERRFRLPKGTQYVILAHNDAGDFLGFCYVEIE